MKESISPCWYRVSVKAIIIKNKAVLLVKEGSDFWDFPGGGLEHNEDVSGGLSREVLEELHTEVASHYTAPLYVGKSYDPVNIRPVIVLYFAVSLTSESFTFGDSVTEIAYKEIDALEADSFEPYIRPYFQELLDIIKQEGVSHAHTQS